MGSAAEVKREDEGGEKQGGSNTAEGAGDTSGGGGEDGEHEEVDADTGKQGGGAGAQHVEICLSPAAISPNSACLSPCRC